MSRLYRLLTLAGLLGLLASACGTPTADIDDPEEDWDKGPPEVVVYFVREHESRIWVEPEIHELDRPSEENLRETIELLFTATPLEPALSSEAPAGVEVLATTIRDRVLIVDVSGDITAHSAGSAQEVAFAQQLAHTGAARDTVDAVRLWVQGAPIVDLWGHLDWSQPIEPDPYAVSPITIIAPEAGPGEWTFPVGEVIARGEAQVVDARFSIRLYGPHGELVTEDVVTASATAPERGTWAHTFTIPGPGTYTVEVAEDDPAVGESRPPFVSSRTFEAVADEPDYSLPRCSDVAQPDTGGNQDTNGNQADDPSDGEPVEVDDPPCIERTEPTGD